MKLIEFVIYEKGLFSILLIDLNDFSFLKKTSQNHICTLFTKQSQSFSIIGTHRGLTNRITYGFSKKNNFYNDSILQPSILVYHNPQQLDCSDIFVDQFQCYGLFLALHQSIPNNLPDYLQDKMKESDKFFQKNSLLF